MEYTDLLRDARWLIKRKKIITRDGFKCTACSSKKKLHVHHTFYYKQPTDPWEYPDDSLLTLCEKCHHKWHKDHKLNYRDRPDRRKNKIISKGEKVRKRQKQKKHIDRYADLPKRLKRRGDFNNTIGKDGIQGAIRREMKKVQKRKK